MRTLFAAVLALFCISAHAQFSYPSVCEDDPLAPDWRVCQYYQNLGSVLCPTETEFPRVYHSNLLPAGVSPATRLWVQAIDISAYGYTEPARGYVSGYLWYPTGQPGGGNYNTCKAVDGQGYCVREFRQPGAWLNSGDWITTYVSCGAYTGSFLRYASVGVVFRYLR